MKRVITLVLCLCAALSAQTETFIRTRAKSVALSHVKVVDGTGAPERANQTIVINNGRIQAVGDAGQVSIPADAEVLDLPGSTVIPGLVGMHEHLFYPSGQGVPVYIEHAVSFPRLYLASGVTTARTGGGIEIYTDLMVKKAIDEGRSPGPDMHITAGYLEGPGSFTPQMLELRNPADARAFVEYWADRGATSFKAYMHITPDELSAAIAAAHARKLKVTGHLCSVGFREAAALGIDNLEHGLVVDTEYDPAKRPGICPPPSTAAFDIPAEKFQPTITDLVKRGVAVTSTLAVFEVAPPLQQRFLDALSPQAALNYLAGRDRLPEASHKLSALRIRKEVEFERAFVKGGGLLLAGADPTGNGSALAGFADQRNIELMVAGGFTFAEAIQIATLNGAKFLGLDKETGSIAVGKRADLAVLDGGEIGKVSLVFKNGVGYDSAKLLNSIRGMVGMH